jgi:hypothetical protein
MVLAYYLDLPKTKRTDETTDDGAIVLSEHDVWRVVVVAAETIA